MHINWKPLVSSITALALSCSAALAQHAIGITDVKLENRNAENMQSANMFSCSATALIPPDPYCPIGSSFIFFKVYNNTDKAVDISVICAIYDARHVPLQKPRSIILHAARHDVEVFGSADLQALDPGVHIAGFNCAIDRVAPVLTLSNTHIVGAELTVGQMIWKDGLFNPEKYLQVAVKNNGGPAKSIEVGCGLFHGETFLFLSSATAVNVGAGQTVHEDISVYPREADRAECYVSSIYR